MRVTLTPGDFNSRQINHRDFAFAADVASGVLARRQVGRATCGSIRPNPVQPQFGVRDGLRDALGHAGAVELRAAAGRAPGDLRQSARAQPIEQAKA